MHTPDDIQVHDPVAVLMAYGIEFGIVVDTKPGRFLTRSFEVLILPVPDDPEDQPGTVWATSSYVRKVPAADLADAALATRRGELPKRSAG